MLKYRISVVIMNNTMPSVASLLWLLLKKFFQKLVLVCWVWITHESHGWLHCGDCCHQNCKILIKTGQLSKIIEIGERHYRSIEFIYNFHSNHIAVRTLLKVWEKSVRNQNSRTNKRIHARTKKPTKQSTTSRARAWRNNKKKTQRNKTKANKKKTPE